MKIPSHLNCDGKIVSEMGPWWQVACMCQWTGSSLTQLLPCHLFSTKALPETMLTYHLIDTLKQAATWILPPSHTNFLSRYCIWQCHLHKCGTILLVPPHVKSLADLRITPLLSSQVFRKLQEGSTLVTNYIPHNQEPKSNSVEYKNQHLSY